jgi:hypothetical protein
MSSTSVFHIAQQLMKNIKELPLWVQEVIYIELQEEMLQHFTSESLKGITNRDTLALLIPQITIDGEQMLLELKNDLGQFLMDAKQNLTILDICIRHEWSLETCCVQMEEAIRSQWVTPPRSAKALGTMEYMANQIRLGEYLVKMGRITSEQLDQALRTQQYIKEALQEHTGLANILINLGYITRQDTESILSLKEESRKPVKNSPLLTQGPLK